MTLEKIINEAWENKDQVNQNSDSSLKEAINQVIKDLDSGKSRVAENKWTMGYTSAFKKAIMLSFRIYPMENLNVHIAAGMINHIYLKAKQQDGQKRS